MMMLMIATCLCVQDEEPIRPKLEPSDDSGFFARLRFGADLWLTTTAGATHADEYQSPEHGGLTLLSSRLDLRSDLAMDQGLATMYRMEFSISDRDRIIARALVDRSGWDGTLGRDIVYNETAYAAGTDLHAELHHVLVTLAYERTLFTLFEDDLPTTITLRAGWSLDRVSVKLEGNGIKKGEDLTDEVIPFAGITLRAEVAPWLSFSIRADCGIPLLELTSVSAKTSWFLAGAQVELRPWKDCTIGAGYFFGILRSEFQGIEFDRDGADNAIDLDQNGFLFSVDLRF